MNMTADCVQVSDGPVAHIKKSGAALPVPALQSLATGPTYQRRINTCRAELQQLVQQKREQCSAERMAKQMMESAEWESRPPPPGSWCTHARTHVRIIPLTAANVCQGGILKACWSLTSTSTKPASTGSACLTNTPSSPRPPMTGPSKCGTVRKWRERPPPPGESSHGAAGERGLNGVNNSGVMAGRC